jgi:uncharacterized paraquat-inducible protein A
MTLRKCPGCKNQVEAESEVCPVCGCNPRLRRLGAVMVWGAAVLAVGWVMVHGHWMGVVHHEMGAAWRETRGRRG